MDNESDSNKLNEEELEEFLAELPSIIRELEKMDVSNVEKID